MHYKYLAGMAFSLIGEDTVAKSTRTDMGVWKSIENNLKKAITDLRNLENATATPATKATTPATPPTGKVKNLVNSYDARQKQSATQAALEEARRKVAYYRRWLAMEEAGADQDGNIDQKRLKPLLVVYDRQARQQGMTRIHFHGGKLYTDDQRRQPLSTADMVTHNSGPGKGIYVMSETGNIHVTSHIVGYRHHTSLLAAADVGCAGELEVKAGSLVWLSNKSGHYWPSQTHLLQVLHQLQKNLVPMTFRLTVHSKAPKKDFNTVGAYLKELGLNDEPDYELNKLMAYAQYLTEAILGQKGWRWRVDPSREKPGVYDISTNQLVPHKTVRQWLKSQKKVVAPVQVQRGWDH